MRRRLDAELVRRGLATSRTEAAQAVRAGKVRVAGRTAEKTSTLVAPDEAVAVEGPARAYVSRGGEKLEAAPRRVAVYAFNLRRFDPPQFDFRVRCSGGTYVRSLVADVGGMGIMACRRLGQSTRARWIIAADRRRSRLLCSCPCGQLKSEAVASNSTFPYRKPKTADRDCEAADTRSRHSV